VSEHTSSLLVARLAIALHRWRPETARQPGRIAATGQQAVADDGLRCRRGRPAGRPDTCPALSQEASMDVQPALPPAAEPALHLLHGWWVASCPGCGYEFGKRRSQQEAEQVGRRRRCPICRPATESAVALPATVQAATR
jgi:hypothetical protein